MFVNVASESGGSKLPSSRPYHLVEMNTSGNKHSDKCNSMADVCNRSKNTVRIHLIILESSITGEGVLSGGGFVCAPHTSYMYVS